MNNRTTETLNKIKAKQKLGLPLTRYENAMIILYGETVTPKTRKNTPRKRKNNAKSVSLKSTLNRLSSQWGLILLTSYIAPTASTTKA